MAVKEFEHAQTTFKRGDDIRLDPGASTHLCLTSQRRAAILGRADSRVIRSQAGAPAI